MKKRILPLLLALVLLLGTLPAAQAASPSSSLADNQFPDFHSAMGYYLTKYQWDGNYSGVYWEPDKEPKSFDDMLEFAQEYVDLLVDMGLFTVISSFKEHEYYSGSKLCYLRYTGTAKMEENLESDDYLFWFSNGPYHMKIEVVEFEGSHWIEIFWDEGLEAVETDLRTPSGKRLGSRTPNPTARPEDIDSGANQTPADQTPGNQTPENHDPAASSSPALSDAVAGLADNQFPNFYSAMGYYMDESPGPTSAYYYDRSKNPMSYDELLQCAQEYVDLLVEQYPFMQVKTRRDLSWSDGGCATYYLRYTGTAEMKDDMQSGDYISWKNYGPYHLKVTVWCSSTNYISVAWDKGLEAVETELRTSSGKRLGKERPSLTAVLAIGYPWMAVGDEVVQVDDLSAEVYPIIENSRTLVPVSRILAALGGESSWDGATRTATFSLGNSTVVVPIGSTRITVNGASRTIDTAAKIYHSRTYAPLRAVLEGLGLWVGYEPVYHLVVVSTDDLSQTKDLVGLEESQRLFASELIPETPTKIVERYAIDGYNYTMEVGEALTLFNPRSAISGYSAYSWEVLDGGELVHRDPHEATCRFYAKRPGVVTVRAYLDEMIVNYFGGSTTNTYTYTMTITIRPSTEAGSSGGLMKYQPCPSCKGSGKIRVGTREETCPTCMGRKFVLQ